MEEIEDPLLKREDIPRRFSASLKGSLAAQG